MWSFGKETLQEFTAFFMSWFFPQDDIFKSQNKIYRITKKISDTEIYFYPQIA